MEILYRIVFSESWRVGSGQGAGPFVDDLVRRDGHGLPFVPGTTLRGLVADALARLAGLLGLEVCARTARRDSEDQPPGELCGVTRPGVCPLCALTGSPHREGRVGWGAARLALTAGGAPVDDPEPRRALAAAAVAVPGLLTRPRPRTALDAERGRAAEERLFSREEAHPGLVLEGRLDLADDLPAREVALLVAALRWVRAVGGSRRRGLGGCRIEIAAADLAPAFSGWRQAVESLAAPAAAGGQGTAAGSGAPSDVSESSASHRPRPTAGAARGGPEPAPDVPALLRLDAVVVGEVAVGGRPEAGNLVPGLGYVPGGALRGALAARWRGDREAAAFGRCFLSGALRFGFLYPVAGQGTALPLPRSIHTCKDRPGRRADLAHGLVDLLLWRGEERCPRCSARLTPWAGKLGSLEAPENGVAPSLDLSPHNRIEPDRQVTGLNSLFAYEVLPDGYRLRGYLRSDDPATMAELLAGAGLALGEPFRLRVGRRKGALGHLRCELHPFDGEEGGVGLFPDAPPVPDSASLPPWVRIDLLTPAVLEDSRLRFRGSLVPADLGLDREDFAAGFAEPVVLSGWNAAHRLPKPDQLAAAAGSCHLVKAPTPAEIAALARAAREGVGGRRIEGFGAVAVRAVAADDRGELP